jgi:uncharacterized Zn finger protein
MSPGSPRWWEYESAGPIAVEGGIKAKSKRGAIGEQWWSQRFIGVLESWGVGGRLQRGRSYARRGQVLEFSLGTGRVTARVQGSRPVPYKVEITVLPLTTAQWREVESRLAARALFRARLLAGEMPAEIEQVFADAGTPLFPRSAADLTMRCSCPDWEVPCKHLAAVCYVLAEAFDADPFAMLAWRGKARDDLLSALRGNSTGGNSGGRAPAGDAGAARERPGAGSPALAVLSDITGPALGESLADFWSPGLSQARLRALPPSPVTPPDLLLRLSDPPPVVVRGTSLGDLLAAAYERLADTGPDAESLPPQAKHPSTGREKENHGTVREISERSRDSRVRLAERVVAHRIGRVRDLDPLRVVDSRVVRHGASAARLIEHRVLEAAQEVEGDLGTGGVGVADPCGRTAACHSVQRYCRIGRALREDSRAGGVLHRVERPGVGRPVQVPETGAGICHVVAVDGAVLAAVQPDADTVAVNAQAMDTGVAR